MNSKIFLFPLLLLMLLPACGKGSEDPDFPPNDFLDNLEKEAKCLLKPECLALRYILENEENEKCKNSAEWYTFPGGSILITDFCANSRRYDIFTVKPIQAGSIADDSDYLYPDKWIYIPSTGYKAYKLYKILSEIKKGDVFEEISIDSESDFIFRDNSGGYYLYIKNEDITYAVLLPEGRQFELKGVKR